MSYSFQLEQSHPNRGVVTVASTVQTQMQAVRIETGQSIIAFNDLPTQPLVGATVKGKGVARGCTVVEQDEVTVTLSEPVTRDLDTTTLTFEIQKPLFEVDLYLTEFRNYCTCRTTIKAGDKLSTTHLTQ